MGTEVVVALDVGGTTVKAGLVDEQGLISAETRRPTGVERGLAAVVEGIVGVTAELVERASSSGVVAVGVGVGVPGWVDSAAGIARYAANLGWHDLELVKILQDRCGLPVLLDHDVRLAGLGESRLGGGVGIDDVFFLSIGTGIASASVRSGHVDSGATGQAGEVGHLVVRPGGALCKCGNRGCLETVASASRIAERYSTARKSAFTAEQVVQFVRDGEPLAGAVWSEAVAALAIALAAVTVLTDPGRIVIGGGLSLAGATLLGPLGEALSRQLVSRRSPPLAVTELGDRAGLIGAGVRAWEMLRPQPL